MLIQQSWVNNNTTFKSEERTLILYICIVTLYAITEKSNSQLFQQPL